MNKLNFTGNAFGIYVKPCCASCAHKCLNRTVSQRVCKEHNKEVRAWECCKSWKMNKALKSLCMSQGSVKRREYQLYLLSIRQHEAENNVEAEMDIEDIRREFESQFGSIYANI